jgi:hypothetical protein
MNLRIAFVMTALSLTGPALAQNPVANGPALPGTGGVHPSIAAHVAPTSVKANAEADRRFLEEQKRVERIMMICTGC